jgi:hypothetical protein
MGTAPRVSTNLSIGFVIDADVPVPDRWAAVCARLAGVGIELPNEAPSSGFIGYSEKFKPRAGVWIMPDNAMNAGQLEDLIKTLVPQGDYLMPHAKAATAKASNLGARFPSVDLLKAELHCWLAWQEEPGLPYGTALKARFFRHDSEVAVRFVAWFRELFRLP